MGIGIEGILHLGRELGPDIMRPQLANAGDVVAGLEGRASRGVDGPDAVALEPPERLLRMVRFSGRSELAKQGGQVGLDLPKRDVLLARLPPAEGVEDEERL